MPEASDTHLPRLPAGYALRRPTRDDLAEVVALLVAADIAVIGESDVTVEDLGAEWGHPRFELDRDAWVVDGPTGLAAFASVYDPNPHVDIDAALTVLAEHRGVGLEERLYAEIERRAAAHAALAPPEVRVGLAMWCLRQDEFLQAFHRRNGFTPVRVFQHMEIDLASRRFVPVWPAGIECRAVRIGRDERPVHAAIDEAFRDHFRHTPSVFEEWRDYMHAFAGPDPDMWFAAWAGDQVAGAVLCSPMSTTGYVDTLAVRRPWRGRGLGAALLEQALATLSSRGFEKAVLGVDASSLTGADRLYTRAGMRVAWEADFFEKTLRDGTGAPQS